MRVELTIRPNWKTLKEAMEYRGLRHILAAMSAVDVPEDAEIEHRINSDEGGSYVTARWDVDEMDPTRAYLRDRSRPARPRNDIDRPTT